MKKENVFLLAAVILCLAFGFPIYTRKPTMMTNKEEWKHAMENRFRVNICQVKISG